MRNRYGDEYYFEQVDPVTYTIKGDLKYWRYGGQEGQHEMDFEDLGFVDPSGGPFIGIGYMINGRAVKRIIARDGEIFFEVK